MVLWGYGDRDEVTGTSSRKLVLHFDVNETIMIEDSVAGHDFEASLNNVIAKVAIIRKDGGRYVWHDGSPMNLAERENGTEAPPLDFEFHLPPGCERYFEVFRSTAAKFTDPGSPGVIYRAHFEALKQSVLWSHEPHQQLSREGRHIFLPAFFRTLHELTRQGRDFGVVIRTFGTDLPAVSCALSAFARGEHPDFPPNGISLQDLELPLSESMWVVFRGDRQHAQSPVSLRRYSSHLDSRDGLGADLSTAEEPSAAVEVIPTESEVETLLAQRRVIGVRDDYFFWRGHNYAPQTGKPLLVTASDDTVQHILFDDNIHIHTSGTVGAVRARATKADEYQAVSGEVLNQLQGIFLVKVSAVAAALDHNYFLQKIEACEAAFAQVKADGRLEETQKW